MTPQDPNPSLVASLRAGNLAQNLGPHQASPALIGCSGSHQLEVLPVQVLSHAMPPCIATDNAFQAQHISTYPGLSLPNKDVQEAQANGLFLNRSPLFMNCFEPLHRSSTGRGVIQGTMNIQQCPLQQSLSANSPAMDAYDPASGFARNCFVEEKFSSNDKSSGSSTKSIQARPSRWKPNPHQLELLEQYFNTGATRATHELHAAVQGCGYATEHNVNVWLKNRASRHKKSPSEKQKESRSFHEVDSDDDESWGDFKAASHAVLHELNDTVSAVSEGDALMLARAIQEARCVLCFGSGKQSLVMKGLASGLHHLGYTAFFMDDTNAPSFDGNTLVLVGAGPGCGNRVSGMIEDVLAAGSHVIAFAPYKLREAQHLYTIQIPTRHRLLMGQDGEVMSSMSEQDSRMSSSIFDLSLTMLCEIVCVMLRKASDITPAEIRARHTNLE